MIWKFNHIWKNFCDIVCHTFRTENHLCIDQYFRQVTFDPIILSLWKKYRHLQWWYSLTLGLPWGSLLALLSLPFHSCRTTSFPYITLSLVFPVLQVKWFWTSSRRKVHHSYNREIKNYNNPKCLKLYGCNIFHLHPL